MESYAGVRRFVFVEVQSPREVARVFGLNQETVAKMCRLPLPPGYTRKEPAAKSKLGPQLPVVKRLRAGRQPLLHALFHIQIWSHRGFSLDGIAAFDFGAVIAPAFLAAALAWRTGKAEPATPKAVRP